MSCLRQPVEWHLSATSSDRQRSSVFGSLPETHRGQQLPSSYPSFQTFQTLPLAHDTAPRHSRRRVLQSSEPSGHPAEAATGARYRTDVSGGSPSFLSNSRVRTKRLLAVVTQFANQLLGHNAAQVLNHFIDPDPFNQLAQRLRRIVRRESQRQTTSGRRTEKSSAYPAAM